MNQERLRELLKELNHELHAGADLDIETRELLRQLHDDINSTTDDSPATAMDRAKQLESKFAASHPIAERIARELADALSKMGI